MIWIWAVSFSACLAQGQGTEPIRGRHTSGQTEIPLGNVAWDKRRELQKVGSDNNRWPCSAFWEVQVTASFVWLNRVGMFKARAERLETKKEAEMAKEKTR